MTAAGVLDPTILAKELLAASQAHVDDDESYLNETTSPQKRKDGGDVHELLHRWVKSSIDAADICSNAQYNFTQGLNKDCNHGITSKSNDYSDNLIWDACTKNIIRSDGQIDLERYTLQTTTITSTTAIANKRM
jgi:hypothetical protein